MNSRWVQWHEGYRDPISSLSRRLIVVQHELRTALEGQPVRQLISLCAGDGRDVLPVLAEGHRDIHALLVELDPVLADRAREHASTLGLDRVVVRTADAGTTDAYLDTDRAQVVLACGVFGNITPSDASSTVAALPTLLDRGGVVIWTRGRSAGKADPSRDIRRDFAEHGFVETSFSAPADARFRVGVHRMTRMPAPFDGGRRLFTFVD